MTRILDNSKEKLALALVQEFTDINEISIASAYFNVHGYGPSKEGLGDKPLLFLLSREPTKSIKWEEEVLREVEGKEDNIQYMQYFMLLQDATDYFDNPCREVWVLGGWVLTGLFIRGKAYVGAQSSLKAVRRGG